MSIGGINYNQLATAQQTPAFTSAVQIAPQNSPISSGNNNGDTVEFSNKKTEDDPSIGKRLGVAYASSFLPGLGQAINGQWSKGVGFFFLNMLVPGVGQCWSAVDAAVNAKK